jgi:hypothetical protein
MSRPTTLESIRTANEHLATALGAIRDARDRELAAAVQSVNRSQVMVDEHTRHLFRYRLLIKAERLVTNACEVLS